MTSSNSRVGHCRKLVTCGEPISGTLLRHLTNVSAGENCKNRARKALFVYFTSLAISPRD